MSPCQCHLSNVTSQMSHVSCQISSTKLHRLNDNCHHSNVTYQGQPQDHQVPLFDFLKLFCSTFFSRVRPSEIMSIPVLLWHLIYLQTISDFAIPQKISFRIFFQSYLQPILFINKPLLTTFPIIILNILSTVSTLEMKTTHNWWKQQIWNVYSTSV